MFSTSSHCVIGARLRRHCSVPILSVASVTTCVSLIANSGAVAAGSIKPSVAEQSMIIYRADQRLIKSCMRTQGFSYSYSPASVVLPEQLFPFGIDELGWARANGFGREILDEMTASQKYVARLSTSDRNRYFLDLNGPGPIGPGVTASLPTGEVIGHSTSGCIASADRELYGNYRSWFKVSSQYQDLNNLVVNRVLQSNSYRSAVLEWSSCMSIHGHAYLSPAQAMHSFLTAMPPMPREIEHSVAQTEVNCGITVGLFRFAHRLEDEDAGRIRRQYSMIVSANRRFNAAALPRAEKVLGLS